MNNETAAFFQTLTDAGISQPTLEILQSQSLSDAQTLGDTSQSELTDIGITLGDAKKLKRLFPSDNPAGPGIAIELDLTHQTNTPQAPTPNPYLYLLNGDGSSTGVNITALNPNIKPDFIKMAAQATCAYVLLSGDILEIFGAAFWRELGLEDLNLRGAIDDWLHQKESQQSISKQAIANLTAGVENLYGNSFDQMVQVLTRLSAQKQMLRTMGAQAQINIGSDATDVVKLTQLVPLTAEELTGKMLMSRLPEQAGRLIKVISALMALLKDPKLHASAGVIAQSPDEGAVKFLQKRLDSTFVNRFRLALSYEKLVNALAQCPSPSLMTMDYLEVLGQLGSDLDVYFGLVTQGTTEDLKPFSRISALKCTEKKSAQATTGNYPERGWPFPTHTAKVPAKTSGVVAFAFGPATGELRGSTIKYAVLAGIFARGSTIESLIWLGESGASGMTGCTVKKLYCQFNGEPGGTGNTINNVTYKTRQELIEMAIEAANARGVPVG